MARLACGSAAALAMVLVLSTGAGAIWVPLADLGTARAFHSATRLADGKVLVAGGWNLVDDFLSSAIIFDPATNTWADTGSMIEVRADHQAILLHDGRVLVFGGFVDDNLMTNYLMTAEAYDPATGQWETVGSLELKHPLGVSANVLDDGRVLVVGGATAELFDPVANSFSPTGSLNTNRANHIGVNLPDGRVLVTGGSGVGSTRQRSSEIYDPAYGTWSPAADMNDSRCCFDGVLLDDNSVLVVAGRTDGEASSTNAEVYEISSDTWTPVGSLTYSQSENVVVKLPDGRVLSIGSERRETEVYDPAEQTWSLAGNLHQSRTFFTATSLNDGRVLVVGGTDANVDAIVSVEYFTPIPPVPGDTNDDGKVDIQDLIGVRNNFANGVFGGPRIPGDAYPFDGLVDLADLVRVRNNFGTPRPVPEPAGWVLFLCGAAILAVRRDAGPVDEPAGLAMRGGRAGSGTRRNLGGPLRRPLCRPKVPVPDMKCSSNQAMLAQPAQRAGEFPERASLMRPLG